jgi:threonine/homoserine/homoserine lactone efflux protein
MLGTHELPLFVASGLLLNITPGADTLYIVTRSATQGVRAGVAAALGIALGCCVHITAAALGLSAVLAASVAAFTVVKILGAVYLVYIGATLLLRRSSPGKPGATLAFASIKTIFVQGFLTNVLNPKVALFFLAFVPQFIDRSAPHAALAFIFLGAIFNFNGTLWCLFLAWSAARIGALDVERRAMAWVSRGVGALFIFLGLRLAFGRLAT